jgi:hypothetical protein
VVAERRAVLIRTFLQPCDFAGVRVDDDAMDHRHVFVARERILPRLEPRMADLGADEVHLADLALVLLEGRDLLRVGRPD